MVLLLLFAGLFPVRLLGVTLVLVGMLLVGNARIGGRLRGSPSPEGLRATRREAAAIEWIVAVGIILTRPGAARRACLRSSR